MASAASTGIIKRRGRLLATVPSHGAKDMWAEFEIVLQDFAEGEAFSEKCVQPPTTSASFGS